MLNFENLNRYIFPGVGRYGIPQIEPVKAYPQGEFIPMNYAKSAKSPESKIVHCFVDDYQFARYWNRPDDYVQKLSRFAGVCSPDFSAYTDMPPAMQIYNHYRKHWLAAYWQLHGITVYPTISWSDESSYDWCFDGEPAGGIVAVSSVGTQRDKESKRLFLRGYEEMMKRLEPTWVIFCGYVPEECDWNVIRVKPHQDSIKERRERKRAEEARAAASAQKGSRMGANIQRSTKMEILNL